MRAKKRKGREWGEIEGGRWTTKEGAIEGKIRGMVVVRGVRVVNGGRKEEGDV